MAEGIERYGLTAEYSFEVKGNAFASMDHVVNRLQAIEQQVQQTANAIRESGIGKALQQSARQLQSGVAQTTRQAERLTSASRQANEHLKGLRGEFRALRAESRNIDLNPLDPSNFKQGVTQVNAYIEALKRLEQQTDATTTEGRELVAQLQAQQRMAQRRINVANQRQVAEELRAADRAATAAARQINDLGAEFRALRAESHNINFGDLTDVEQFRRASNQIDQYIADLKRLEAQVDRTTPQGRTLAATVQRQQTIAQSRVDIASNQRIAAMAQQRQGAAAGITAASGAALFPIVSIGDKAIDVLVNFNDQMSKVEAVIDPLQRTQANLDAVRQKAKDLGAETRFSASEAASGFVLLAQAGYKVDQQLTAIDGTLKLAAAGDLELAQATDITVSALGGFQLGADQAIHVADVLAKTANTANLDVADLGESLKYVAPAAKLFNASVEQTNAMLGVLSEAGIKGSQAGTSLRMMFLRLAAPPKTAAGAMQQLGLQVSDSRGKLKSMDVILEDMRKRLKKFDEAKRIDFIKDIFGVEASSAASYLLDNVNGIRELTKANEQSSKGMGAAADAAAIMERNIGGAFRNFQSAAEGVYIEIAEVLEPAVVSVTNAFSKLLQGFIKLPKPVKTAIVVTGGIVAGLLSLSVVAGTVAIAMFGLQAATAQAAIGLTAMATSGIPLTGFFATVMTAFTSGGIITGFTALGSSIGAAGAAVATFATGPIGIAIAAGAAVVALLEILTPKFNALGAIVGAALSPVAFLFGVVKGALEGLSIAFRPVLDQFKGMGVDGQYLGNVLKTIAIILQGATTVGQTFGKVLGVAVGVVIATPLRLVIGLFKSLYNVVEGVGQIAGAIANPFIFAAQRIQQAWAAFVTWFQEMPLVSWALSAGQGLINALNHSPTVQIPIAWQSATNLIQGFLGGLVEFGRTVGATLINLLNPAKLFGGLISGLVSRIKALVEGIQNSGLGKILGNTVEGFSNFLTGLDKASTDQPLVVPVEIGTPDRKREDVLAALPTLPPGGNVPPPLPNIDETLAAYFQDINLRIQEAKIAAPIIPPPTIPATSQQLVQAEMRETLNVVAVEARQGIGRAFDTVTAEWGDRWRYLQATGGTDVMSLFSPGIQQLRQSFVTLGSDIGSFVVGAGKALLTLDFDTAKTAATEFGVNLKSSIDSAGGAMKGLILSTAAFGVFSLASLSPLVLVLGGIVLGVAAIATNFLGIRTILGGLIKMVQGVFRLGQGIIEMITSIGTAVYRIGQSIQTILGGVPAALRGDLSQVRQGVDIAFTAIQTSAVSLREALNRSLGGIEQIFKGMGQVGQGAFQGLRQIAIGTGDAIQLAFRGTQVGIKLLIQGIELARKAFTALLRLPAQLREQWQALTSRIRTMPLSVNLQPLRSIPTVVTNVSQQVRNAFQQLRGFLGNLALRIDHDDWGRLPGIAQNIGQQIQNVWQQLRGFLSGLSLRINREDWDKLPGIAQNVANQVEQAWRTLTTTLDNIPVLQEFITFVRSLPQVFGNAIEAIQTRWSSLSSSVGGVLNRLTGKSKQTGQQLVSNLAENSPGPTYQIRTKWRALAEFIEGRLETLQTSAKVAGQQMAGGLGRVGAVGKGLSGSVGKVGNLFSSLGVTVSNFSPQLAGPLFLVGDLTDSFVSLSDNLPETQKLFGKLTPQLKSFGAIAKSNVLSVVGSMGGVFGGLAGTIGTIMPSIVASVGGAFSAIAATATVAWTTVLAPALPFIAAIAGVIGVVVLLRTAFRRNFLGIRTTVETTLQGIRQAFSLMGQILLLPFTLTINTIKTAWQGFSNWFSTIMGGLPNFAQQAGQAIIGFLNHHPTIVIPNAWQGATERIQSNLLTLTGNAEATGSAMTDSLTIQPDVKLDATATHVSGMVSTVSQGVQALNNQFRGLTFSTVLFGVASLTSFSPLILVLGGVALAALAIATNFLGIRTVLSGVIRAVLATADILIAAIRLIVQTVQGVVQIIGGIPAALQGDFNQIGAGIQTIFGAIQDAAIALRQGLIQILSAGIQIIEGAFVGLGNLVSGSVFGNIIESARQMVQQIQQWLGGLGNSISNVLSRIPRLGKKQSNGAATTPVADIAPPLTTPDLPPLIQPVQVNRQMQDDGRVSISAIAAPEIQSNLGNLRTDLGDTNAQLTSLQNRAESALGATSSGLSSLGTVLGAFSPQLAGPLFLVTGLIDGFVGMAQALPILKAALLGQTAANAATTVSNVGLATSNQAVAVTSGQAGLGLLFAKAQAIATSIWNGILTAANWVLSLSFAGVGAAATAAWAAITGPLLPIIIGIGAVIVAVMAIRKVFETNFLGIRSLIGSVANAFGAIINTIKTVTGAIATLGTRIASTMILASPVALMFRAWGDVARGVFQGIEQIFGETIGTIQEVLSDIVTTAQNVWTTVVQPFRDLFASILTGTQQSGQQINFLGKSIEALTAVLMVPLRVAGFLFGLMIRSVGLLIQTLIQVGGVVLQVLAVPFRIAAMVAMSFIGVVQGIGEVFRSLWDAATSIGGAVGVVFSAFSDLGNAIVSVFRALSGGAQQGGVDLFGGLLGVVQLLLIPLKVVVSVLSIALNIVAGIIRLVATVLTPVIKLLAVPIQAIAFVINGIAMGIKGIFSIVGAITSFIGSAAQAAYNLIPAPIRWVIETMAKGVGMIFGLEQSTPAPAPTPQKFAVGGLVPGQGVGDRVPALLTPGEFVMNASATQAALPLLQMLNAGNGLEAFGLFGGMINDVVRQQMGLIEGLGNIPMMSPSLEVMAIAPPALVSPPSSTEQPAESATVDLSGLPPIQITIQNINIIGGTGEDMAGQLMAAAEPEIQRMIRDALRDIVERTR